MDAVLSGSELDVGQQGLVDVEVRVDLLDVVVVLERVEQAHHAPASVASSMRIVTSATIVVPAPLTGSPAASSAARSRGTADGSHQAMRPSSPASTSSSPASMPAVSTASSS
jgi:hypothetical protein